jgi:hypothetical protein
MLEWVARHIGRATNHPLQITSALSVVVKPRCQWFAGVQCPVQPQNGEITNCTGHHKQTHCLGPFGQRADIALPSLPACRGFFISGPRTILDMPSC